MLLYQKPEISVEETFADRQVPDSWLRVDQSDRLYDWNEYISRLRIDKQNTDQALDLFRSDADLAGFPWATSLQPVRVALATAAQPPLQPVPNEPGPSVHSSSQPGTPEPIATPMQSSDRLVHDAQANQPIVPPTADASVLPPKSIESDILDGGGIPTLIAAVLRRTNVEEFLELLGVQACTETGKMTIRQDNRRQFSLMIQQVCRDQNDKDLWMAILTVVERWDNSQTDSTTASSSLLRAGRLLHQTKNGDALDEIKRALVGVFNRWQKSATEHASAPNQLHVLATAMEDSSNVEDYVFPLTALSAPHFSDAGFKTPLLLCLAKLINTVGGATGKRATLWFCVFRATDNVPFDRKLITRTFFGAMKEIWDLVMPETPNPNRMTELKNLLQEDRIKNALRGIEDDRSWALLALEKASNPQQITLPFEYSLVDPTGLKLIAERQET
ncbi:hypothetical protein EI94DRAFT_1011450 [Lactarius quietus]|nr:hypothetical protein EI94DRAFT_1011450 [Lactarius quietus]